MDASRSGQPATVRSSYEAETIRRTTQELPCDATQWSVCSMATAVGVSKDTVRRVWRNNGLKPHLVKTFLECIRRLDGADSGDQGGGIQWTESW